MLKEWVYFHTECDRMFCSADSTKQVATPLKAQCQDDAEKEGKKLWEARLKEGLDDHYAKRIGDKLYYPEHPRVRLEISIPTDLL